MPQPVTGRTVSAALSLVLTLVVIDTVAAQGPLRRLGDRVRDRVGGALLPGNDAPDSPQPPQGRRPLLGRSPADNPNATGNSALAPQPPQRGFAANPASRSANYNRAAASPPRPGDRVGSPVEQSSAWQSRQEPRAIATNRPAAGTSVAMLPPTPGARLGVVVDPPPLVAPAGLPPRRARGALVAEVQPESAAEVAGLQVGDLIVGVDGRVITSVSDLTERLSEYQPGDEARLQLVRQEELLVADVVLAGPDGIAIRRPAAVGVTNPAPTAPSIINGLGAALGGLFGGGGNGAAPTATGTSTAPAAPAIAPSAPAAVPPESIRNALPEALPPPIPEADL